ncbi:hypothetical protein JCM11754A_24130 [Isoptericola variabilis]
MGLAHGSGGAADVVAADGVAVGGMAVGAAAAVDDADEGADSDEDDVPNGDAVPVVANGERRVGPSGRGATVAGGLATGGAALAGGLDGAASGGIPRPPEAPGAAPWSRRVEVRAGGAAGAPGAGAGRTAGVGATARDISPVGRWIGARRPVSSSPRTPAEVDGGRTIGAGAGAAGAGLCSRSERRDGAPAAGAENRGAGAWPAGGPNGDRAAAGAP